MSRLIEVPTRRGHWNSMASTWERWEPMLMYALGSIDPTLLRVLGLAPGQRVVDLACGMGDPAIAIARWVGPRGRVVGIDLSERMIGVARTRARLLRVGNVRFRRGDMNRFHHAGPRYQRAVCRYGLMFARDLPETLRRIRSGLVRGGRFAAAVWGPMDRNPGQALRAEAAAPFREPEPDPEQLAHPMRLARPGLLARLFREAGFRRVRSVEAPGITVYPGLDAAVRMMAETSLCEVFDAITPRERRLLSTRLERRVRRFVDRGGAVRIPSSSWVVSGER